MTAVRRSRSLRINIDVVIRIIADTLLVNLALMIAFALRYLWLVGVEGITSSAQATLRGYAYAYLGSFWLLTIISLVLFYVTGFYTRNRAYQGRYKAVAVAQAVSVSYLIFGCIILFLWDVIQFPRSALLMGWILTLVFVIGVRLSLDLWQTYVKEDYPFVLVPDEKIKHLLVIGGAGYIGSALLPKLLEKGYYVRLLDLLVYGADPISPLLDHPRLELIQDDFLKMDTVVAAMRGMDAVVHLGAIVGDPACEIDRGLTVEVNLIATRMIAEVAKVMKVKRFVFASTCSVYGACNQILDEYSVHNPLSLYASSKCASEKVLRNLADSSFRPVILRFGTTYGFSGRTRFDLVINLLTAKAVVDGEITVFGGDQWRPFVHVDDAALAILKVIEAPESVVGNEVFNVGTNDQNYTIQEIGEIVHRLVPGSRLVSCDSDGDLRSYRVDFTKIRRALNFTPRWTVETGVQQVIDAFESGAIQNYRDARYSNVKYLRAEGMSHFRVPKNARIYDLLNEAVPVPDGGVLARTS